MEANLKINPKKCFLFSREVRYLSHIISEKGVTMDPEKTSVIENWPSQKQETDAEFLRILFLLSFVKGFSLQAKPLFELTENYIKFI